MNRRSFVGRFFASFAGLFCWPWCGRAATRKNYVEDGQTDFHFADKDRHGKDVHGEWWFGEIVPYLDGRPVFAVRANAAEGWIDVWELPGKLSLYKKFPSADIPLVRKYGKVQLLKSSGSRYDAWASGVWSDYKPAEKR